MIAMNGVSLRSDEAMRVAVFNAPKYSVLTLVRMDSGVEEEVDVVLRGEPMRIGISWREDAANPNAPMISRIIPGSPAAKAGLMSADRIHAVNGDQWKSGDDNLHPFVGIEFPITVTYERNGHLSEAILNDGDKAL